MEVTVDMIIAEILTLIVIEVKIKILWMIMNQVILLVVIILKLIII